MKWPIATKTTKRRRWATAVAGALACSYFGTLEAQAQTSDSENSDAPERAAPANRADVVGTVVGIDENDIVLDLGSTRGATEGRSVELWRPFRLRHPVTGKFLIDRFRIGSLKLVQVQRTLALSRAEGDLARKPAQGDVVILPGDAVAGPGAAKSSLPVGQPPAAATDTMPVDERPIESGEAGELSALFEKLKGTPPAARIARYEQYAASHPRSKYARVLIEEAGYLRRLFIMRPGADDAKANALRPALLKPELALAATPLSMAIEAPGAAGAVLHVRPAGEMTYRSIPMRDAGSGYFRAVVPADRMKAPDVEYFVESVNGAGVAAPLVATAEQPLHIEVHDAPRPEPPAKTDATAGIFTDYADYNRLRRNDFAWQTEGYFGLRYRDVGVRAVRSGFGVYRGVGGSLEELDTLGLQGRKVGLTYGYLEGEFGITSFTALIGRLALGLTEDGVTGGGQFFVRLGNDKVTNILLGGEALGGIGLKGIAELQWNTIARVPIVIRTEVTNQPAGTGQSWPEPIPGRTSIVRGDVGARAMVQIGYRVVPSLTLAVRGSYEGRTIQHAGPGAGLGVTYSW